MTNDQTARQATAAARATAMLRMQDAYAAGRPADPEALARRASAHQPGDDARIAEAHRLDAAGLLSASARTALGHAEAARDAATELERLRTDPAPTINPRKDS